MQIHQETMRLGGVYLIRRRHLDHTAKVLALRPAYLVAQQESRMPEMQEPRPQGAMERVLGTLVLSAIVAVFLIFRVRWRLRQPLRRVQIDGPPSGEQVVAMLGEHPEGVA